MDDLSFIASRVLIKKMAKTLEKVGKIVLKWGEKNVMTYNMAKIKLVLFSRACQ